MSSHAAPFGDVPGPGSGPLHDHDHGHDHDPDEPHNDIVYPNAIPFVLVHLAALGAFWSGVTPRAVVLAVVLYLIRMWAITAGFHRYFSHRSFKTSRVFQFVLAFLAQMSAQRGALWWAAVHRVHHLHSDTEHDVHSPRHTGFWFSHVGWIFAPKKSDVGYDGIQDFTKYPELVWLDRWSNFPALLLALFCLWFAGWPGLFVGFFVSTVVLYHATFAINSVAHVSGSQRYLTGDDSRNNWLLALLTLGEGWHNNHHYYQSSTRQGFRWWEIDVSYYVLKAMSWVGLVWGLRAPPAEVVRGELRPGRKVIERVAGQLAATFDADALARQLRDAWAHTPGWSDLTVARERVRERARELLAELPHPSFPSVEELRARARDSFAGAPSVDEIAERAREILEERMLHRLAVQLGATRA